MKQTIYSNELGRILSFDRKNHLSGDFKSEPFLKCFNTELTDFF